MYLEDLEGPPMPSPHRQKKKKPSVVDKGKCLAVHTDLAGTGSVVGTAALPVKTLVLSLPQHRPGTSDVSCLR